MPRFFAIMVALCVAAFGIFADANAQIRVTVEPVDSDHIVVAGSIIPACQIHLRAGEEDLNLRNLRISQVYDSLFSRSVNRVTIVYQEGNWSMSESLDEAGNADFSFGGDGDERIIIPAWQARALACLVELNHINPWGAQTGDILAFVLRSRQGFLVETPAGQQIQSFGDEYLLLRKFCLRGNRLEFPEGGPNNLQAPDFLANGPVDLYRFQVQAPEGTDISLTQVPFHFRIEDTVPAEAILNFSQFRLLEGSSWENVSHLTEATSGQDAYAIWTSDGRRISGRQERLAAADSTHRFYVQFYDERLIPAGQSRYYVVRAVAQNVDTGVNSNDACATWMVETEPVSPEHLNAFVDMNVDDEGEPEENPIAEAVVAAGDEYISIGSGLIWSDITGTNGDYHHSQYGPPSSPDYILGLLVDFPPVPRVPLTYFSVYGNEYDGQREHLHQPGDTIGLRCRINCPQPISGIQFDLAVRNDDGSRLAIDSISLDQGLIDEVDASFRNDRILVYSLRNRPIDLENRNFLTAWITLPDNAHGIYQVVPDNIILSDPEINRIQVDEVHQGWFFAGPLGDLTLDGALDVRDLLRLVNLALDGGMIWEDRVGDLNQDWTVDAEDIALLIDAILDGAGRDSPDLELAEVWQGDGDDVWQYQLSNQNPVRVFQLALRGGLEGVEPYLTQRSAGMSLAYRYFPGSRLMKIVAYSLGNAVEPGQGPVLIVPGTVEEVIFEKVVQVNPQGVPGRPFKGKPTGFLLDPAYPNPFNSSTRVSFELPQAGRAIMAVYDLSGREAAKLIDSQVSAGANSVIFYAKGLATGTYILRLKSQQGIRSQKLTFIK